MKSSILSSGRDDLRRIQYSSLLKYLLLLILCANTAMKAVGQENAYERRSWKQIDVLETVNSFAGEWCCTNDGYIYGLGVEHGPNAENYVTVLRKSENGQSFEKRGSVTTIDPSYTIQYRIFSTSVPGVIFVPVKDSQKVFHLLKSSDGGLTFKKVFTFGEGNGPAGANAAYVRILRGILELTHPLPGGGGTGTLYIGEYNNSPDRITGSTNDRVRIMKSVDAGSTWTKVMEWNTNGSNQVGHIHAMKQDPYTGEVYICTGDNNLKAGIIKWDGSSPWADNKTLKETGYLKGFKVLTGAQRYRVCDVLFDENYFYTFADTQTPNNPTGSESGIWRGHKNFSTFTRVDNQIYDYDPMHIGWYGEKIGNTFVFTTAREYEGASYAWKELNTRVYTSNDGLNWHASGVINWRDTGNPTRTAYITNVFTFNNNIYIDCVGGAGHFSTIKCEPVKKWKTCEDPVILHPVYFVGRWNTAGNDANPGTTPDSPKRTLNSALTLNNISAGSRVKVAEGTFNEPSIYAQWSAALIQGAGSVIIEGMGMDKTHIIRSSGSGNTYGIRIEASRTMTNANTPFILKDLDFYLTTDGGINHSNYVIDNIDSYIKTIACTIGNRSNDDSPLIYLNAGSKYASENSFHIANAERSIYKTIISSGSANTSFHLQNCIAMNAYNAFESNYRGAGVSLKNCTIYGIENAGILFGADFNTTPVIKNCIFSCGSTPIRAAAGLTTAEIDYNLYNKGLINVHDGGHSLAVGTDPSLVNPENKDFNLNPDSPCIMKGISLSGLLFDFESRERRNPPCIGAFEKIALFAEPSDIVIAPLSGSTGEINIISNTSWSVSVDVAWLNLSSPTGNGSSTIVTTAITSNSSKGSRIANLVISSPELSPVNVIVRQLCDIVTDCSEPKGDELIVYPNPVSGMLNVDYKDSKFSNFNILNLNGLKIHNEKVVNPMQRIDFSKYSKGLYILEFVTNTGEVKRVKVVNK